MEQWHFLIATAVGDQAVTTLVQFQLADQGSHTDKQVAQKIQIAGLDCLQTWVGALWDDQDMERVSRSRVVEGNQRRAFMQPFQTDQMAHVGKHPGQQPAGQRRAGKL
jgi:hypothetical protein